MKRLNLPSIARRIMLVIFTLVVAVTALAPAPKAVMAADSTPPRRGLPRQIADIHKGIQSSSPNFLTPIGSILFFAAFESEKGLELYKSYPPYDEAILVKDINPSTGDSSPSWLVAKGDTLFFNATDGVHGYELWKSVPPYDESSTMQVTEISPNGDSDPSNITPIGEGLLFTADDGSSGPELWYSQSPYNYARQVADIFPGPTGSIPYDLVNIGFNLFFITKHGGYGQELWMSAPPYTQATTRRIKDIFPTGNAYPGELTPVGVNLFFRANGGGDGYQLWKSVPPYDEESTVQITKSLNLVPEPTPPGFPPYEGSRPSKFTSIGDIVFFTANINLIGFELWKSKPDYTITSTTRVDDINSKPYNPVNVSAFSSAPDQLTSIGETLLFRASDGKTGMQLWKTDPPYIEATLVKLIKHGKEGCIPDNLTVIGSTLFFTATDWEKGMELWKSSPPFDEEHTIRVTDINEGKGNSWINNLSVIGNNLFFRANDGKTGVEPYVLETDYILPETGFAPGRITAVRPQSREKAYTGMNDMSLKIPALGTDVPLVGVPEISGGWDLTWLGKQAGYLNGTAFPTLPGNSVITSHAYLKDGTPGPFLGLERLKWGDPIIIHAWGQKYIFEARSIQKVEADDTRAFDHAEQPWITLITCQGFDESSQTYLWRIVVKAVLVRVE